MSQDRFTEVTTQSWLSRIGGAIKGILLGLILFVVAFPLLFWNEGRAVTTYKTLKEGGSIVTSVASDSVDPANAGRLIHVTGLADTETRLTDPVFEVSAKALKLRRTAEMYQWKEDSSSETTKKLGGGTETVTEYSYSKTWSERSINSDNFKKSYEHPNPSSMPYTSTQQTADRVTLDAFTLSPSLVRSIDSFEPLVLGSDTALPDTIKETGQLYGAGFYIGADSTHPQVGDMRVRFDRVKPVQVSVIAKQVGNTFEPYVAKARGSIELLQIGVHSADAMIQTAQTNNTMLTWLFRLAGFVCMMIGLNLFLRPLSVVADVLPIAGTIVGAGAGLIAFLVAAPASLLTIAIAWIFYRPLIAIILVVIAVSLMLALKGKLKTAKPVAKSLAS
ncbi:TMEM43 family protein [Denitrificimonas caeni]|uniref:TMEM43 family protein n=1 Tax=Denitrificimonas caeni TaxID=521720 RepID=UPI001964A5A9|nr:TMEM43 family protein [Denitrificimonas caeni]